MGDSDVDEVQLVKRQATQYSGETSIHGIKYIGEATRTPYERQNNLYCTFCYNFYACGTSMFLEVDLNVYGRQISGQTYCAGTQIFVSVPQDDVAS
jgi:hypothetical protein